MSPEYNKGIPDRLVLLPGGRVSFVETKRPDGGRVSPMQRLTHARLRKLGFRVDVACTKAEVDALVGSW